MSIRSRQESSNVYMHSNAACNNTWYKVISGSTENCPQPSNLTITQKYLYTHSNSLAYFCIKNIHHYVYVMILHILYFFLINILVESTMKFDVILHYLKSIFCSFKSKIAPLINTSHFLKRQKTKHTLRYVVFLKI